MPAPAPADVPQPAHVRVETPWYQEARLPSVASSSASRGPSIPDAKLLLELKDLMHSPPAAVRMEPSERARNSNRAGHEIEILFVNGMCFDPKDVHAELTQLTEVFGRPVTAIINDEEPSIRNSSRRGHSRALLHSAVGLVSPRLGVAAEPQAVTTLTSYLIEGAITNDRDIQLLAHSQGSIIACNAINLLLGDRSPLSYDDKQKLKCHLNVTIAGAAEHWFPSGARCVEYGFAGDKICKGTAGATFVSQVFAEHRSGAPSQRAEKVMLPGGCHSFHEYAAHVPEFFIQRQQGADGKVIGRWVGMKLGASIEEGTLSDATHEAIIRRMLERRDRGFAQTLLMHVEDGRIGRYEVPHLAELRALAEGRR